MFTGIVEAIGTTLDLNPTAGGYRLRVDTALASDLSAGDSLAVNGVCLTITAIDGTGVHADVGPETARVTNLGALEPGQTVNLERPLRFDGRLGGHLVTGHVDGIGIVEDVRPDADSRWVTIRYPETLAAYFIPKGSIAVDGVSLTIAGLRDRQFDVQVIPYTWQHTTFHRLTAGDKVNLECDMIGKYVVRALEVGGRARP